MLPPGFARLATKPALTGSATCANTIGTVRVACCIWLTAGVVVTKMTSGDTATNSIADRWFPIDTRFVDCGHRSNPIAAIPEQTLRCGPALPEGLWQTALAPRHADSARPAAHARRAAIPPLSHQ